MPSSKRSSSKKAAQSPKGVKKGVKKNGEQKRAPPAYNLFMQNEIAAVKSANPKMEHKEAFKKAAANWKKADKTPWLKAAEQAKKKK